MNMNAAVLDLLRREALTATTWRECENAIQPKWLVPSPEMEAELTRVGQDLTTALGLPEGEFFIQMNTPIGGRPYWAAEITKALLSVAATQGAEAAAGWLDRVLRMTTANCRVFAGIHGLRVMEGGSIAGVRFIPLSTVASSPVVHMWRNRHLAGPDIYSLETLAVLDLGPIKFREQNSFQEAVEMWRLRVADILRAVTYSSGGAPSLGEIFSELNEPDLEPLRPSSGYMSHVENAPRALISVTLTSEMAEAASNHLSINQDFRSRLNLATDRLATSRRRYGAADKSIDLSIAFEALIGAKKFDITYKLGLRTAIVLGRTLDERRDIRKQVEALYDIRSKTVHGDPLEGGNPDAVVARCNALCAQLISVLAVGGRAPDWTATDLTGQLVLKAPASGQGH